MIQIVQIVILMTMMIVQTDTNNDDDELDVLEFDNEFREINENPTLKSNESKKKKIQSQVKY